MQAVTNLQKEILCSKTEEEFFARQMDLVFETQQNKRRGRDAMDYESNIIALTVRSMNARIDRTLRIEHNYAFLVSLPKWREIMATSFEGRKIDHEICGEVIPLAEKVLSPYTFNNRKGKGSQAAINCLIEQICEVTDGYTKPARVIKIDFKGYFPNALWNHAEKCICDIIDLGGFDKEYTAYLKWLTMIAVHCNPASHCEYRTPRLLWGEHITPEKSILNKEEGVGAAIGRLIWQAAMGLYINDIIKWLTDECGIVLTCFVDDIVIVVSERRHRYVLALLSVLRKKLAERNVFLNEKKFYDQPYQHGLEFLGSHIKPFRIHLNNKTYGRAVEKVRLMNKQPYKDIDKMLQCFNSYSGLLKNRTDYKRLVALKDMLSEDWWKWIEWNENKLCLSYKDGHSVNERLDRKYSLKLKRYKTRNSA